LEGATPVQDRNWRSDWILDLVEGVVVSNRKDGYRTPRARKKRGFDILHILAHRVQTCSSGDEGNLASQAGEISLGAPQTRAHKDRACTCPIAGKSVSRKKNKAGRRNSRHRESDTRDRNVAKPERKGKVETRTNNPAYPVWKK